MSKDPRKERALARARGIVGRWNMAASDREVWIVGPPMEIRAAEDRLIQAIAIAIYDAATTGQA